MKTYFPPKNRHEIGEKLTVNNTQYLLSNKGKKIIRKYFLTNLYEILQNH